MTEESDAPDTVRPLAVYQSRDPGPAGPVGATLPTDRKIAGLLGGALVFSGGTPKFVRLLDKAPMTAARAASTRTKPPPTAVPYATTAGPSASVHPSAARRLTISLATGVRLEWTHQADGSWARSSGGHKVSAADGHPLRFANVIVQLAAYPRTAVKSSTGTTVPTPDVLGSGSATVCGRTGCIPGTWQRRGYEAGTNFFDSRHSAIRLSPGSTWTVLAPTNSSVQLR